MARIELELDESLANYLTPAQMQVLDLRVKGNTLVKVAEVLGKSRNTVKSQLYGTDDDPGIFGRAEEILGERPHNETHLVVNFLLRGFLRFTEENQ
ncbi:hypothetical protein A2961_00720 [Candidatus Woesebacteria bacterium RIFCSPLOWO2_01_FULL_39_21]|uniref:Uncharacterized protein n=1 Tax=Candidatus Woesebacteria bacterium RIFCSPLOWO2_01_FULL_39_21 TaxID=1802519 RepID=A0A1F8BMA1_9BACT|nr:MAG: hypothetical protein A2691_02015 [Candidatus Woesebacteria bacterium RIFCSPHIGHO2_01_FULL_39_23]OGM65204.1 MAG: hypothetical protein A2961_00720 [Candidatus Woesebacteria bacterium RIFCSPLOWO2_01_FULL_39_21]